MAGLLWYVLEQDRELGPFTSQQMRQLAERRRIKPDTQVRRADSVWVYANKVSGLSFPAPPPPVELDPLSMIEGNSAAAVAVQVQPAVTQATCPFCRETIVHGAIKCKHCGEFLDQETRRRQALQSLRSERLPPAQPVWSPGVACFLSFIFPGLGQIYKGQILGGFLWMFGVIVGYLMLVIPGLILHLCCMVGAASGDTTERGG